MIIVNGSAVINVIVCSDFSPAKLSNIKESDPIRAPKKRFCHMGVLLLLFEATLFITNIPESADVTKNIQMANTANVLVIVLSGKYSKNLNSKISGWSTMALRAPLATF